MSHVSIFSTGRYVPEFLEPNEKLERELQVERGWIFQRTGIESRAIANPDQAVSDLALLAGRQAVDRFVSNGKSIDKIETMILATSTPDYLLPPTSAKLAYDLGLGNAAAMDLTVACSGFLYAMKLADAICQSTDRFVMIVAANILSRRCKSTDKSTRPIFADAAGAVIIGPSKSHQGILGSAWQSDGSQWSGLTIPDGGSRTPFNERTIVNENHLMTLRDGSAIFKYAVQSMAELAIQVVVGAGLTMEAIDWWIPHQANARIIQSCRRILKIDSKKVLTTVKEFGNSSAASIPVTLDLFLNSISDSDHQIKSGDLVLMTAAAAGMTSAAVLVRIP